MYSTLIAKTKAEPRPYQERVFTKAIDAYTNIGVNSCMIEAPTGSGKTIVALAIARALQEKDDIGVGWVAMRRNLLSQATRANRDLAMGLQDAQFISMFDRRPPHEDHAGRPIRLLIVDEAQHDAVSSMAYLHNLLKPRYVLGLTATPFRTDSIKLCFDKIIKDAGIHALISQGYLSPYHTYTIDEWDVENVTTTYLREPDRWGKSVMFWHKREQAEDCTRRLRIAGIKTELVVADSDPKLERRERQLADFDAGKIDVLVNMFILTEGFDSPSLQTVFVRDSGKGPTIQMSGRVFRKYPGIDYKQVVQSKHTRWPMHRTAAPAQSYVWTEESWRSFSQSRAINAVAKEAMTAMIGIQTTMPNFITKAKEKGRRRPQNQPLGESGLPQRDDSGGGADENWVGGWGGGAIIH